jgi:hypothetical protein
MKRKCSKPGADEKSAQKEDLIREINLLGVHFFGSNIAKLVRDLVADNNELVREVDRLLVVVGQLGDQLAETLAQLPLLPCRDCGQLTPQVGLKLAPWSGRLTCIACSEGQPGLIPALPVETYLQKKGRTC